MKSLDKNNSTPGITEALVFRGKALAFQVRRALQETNSREVWHYPIDNTLTRKEIIAESRSPLWTEHEDSEKILLAGKIHNLRLAIRRLNGVEVPAHGVFSFWKQVGRTSRFKGYVAGRELREGCLIPSIGGGLCHLSNSLYDAALRAGFEIIERHAHTQVIPGSLAETGRDATVFWNYVDLRFKSRHAFRIETALTVDSLIVRFRGDPVSNRKLFALAANTTNRLEKFSREIESCLSCGVQECFRQVKQQESINAFGRTAYLVDEYWPEFDRYISETKRDADILCLPMDGGKLGKSNYAWTTTGFGQVKQNRLATLWRSYQSRKLASQGAARQTALLAAHEKLARRYASLLTYDVTHLCLTQNLLPFLWRSGELGGRTFDVLMTGLPLAVLQKRLDAAFLLHPESQTLSDFRAADWLLELESEALRQARKIITPHPEIAALYSEKSVLVDWAIPAHQVQTKLVRQGGSKIVFPAATLGRKGVYELREAIKELNTRLVIMGPVLECKGFWDGLQVEQAPAGTDWLGDAAAVVLPAFIEHKPRRLLEAVARGVPVIASTACGLENISGVTSVQAGDVNSLCSKLEKVVARSSLIAFEASCGRVSSNQLSPRFA
jgi:glycosyltransferase involved in cell wall biosynthesis